MFAVLGEIIFETLTAPDRLDRTLSWDYAEHRVVEDLPRLQWIADGLETIRLEMLFHASVGDPAAQLEALVAAAKDHQARALVFGNGDHRGYFVITTLHLVEKQMSDVGDPISARVQIDIKQWALASETNPALAPIPGFTPLGIVPGPPGVSTGPVVYASPSGVSGTTMVPFAPYVAPPLAALGVSPLLVNPALRGVTSPTAIARDVPAAAIVRAAA
jgi:phage protein U